MRDGKVRVNGQLVTSLSTNVDAAADKVEVDGRKVRGAKPGRLLVLNKPIGIVCSMKKQGKTLCLGDVLPANINTGRLFHVGRLDADSTGLLLLSDDGDLGHRILHPRNPVWKSYKVTVDGALTPEQLQAIRRGGLMLDGRPTLPARIQRKSGGSTKTHYQVQLREGRRRQIRRMFERWGLDVIGLHRFAFGPIQLGRLPSGGIRPATRGEMAELRNIAFGESQTTPRGGAKR